MSETVFEVNDDVRRVHDRDVSVDQHRDLGPAIHGLETRVLRERQGVDRLVGTSLNSSVILTLRAKGLKGLS